MNIQYLPALQSHTCIWKEIPSPFVYKLRQLIHIQYVKIMTKNSSTYEDVIHK